MCDGFIVSYCFKDHQISEANIHANVIYVNMDMRINYVDMCDKLCLFVNDAILFLYVRPAGHIFLKIPNEII